MLSIRVDFLQRLKNPVGTGRQIGVGHDGLAASGQDRIRDLLFRAGDDHPADICFECAVTDMQDHRASVNVGEWLSRQALGGHPCGDDNDRICFFSHADKITVRAGCENSWNQVADDVGQPRWGSV